MFFGLGALPNDQKAKEKANLNVNKHKPNHNLVCPFRPSDTILWLSRSINEFKK